MKNFYDEISRNIPYGLPSRYFTNGTPILTAYGCVLFERDTGKSYIYTAVNLKNGNSEVLSRRTNPLTTSGVDAMIERLRLSHVAGAGRFEADRDFGEQIDYNDCRKLLLTLFKEILPQHGYTVRKEQIALADHILETIRRRFISLAEAEVGTGKTFAYLLPAILAKRGRLGGYWNMSYYTGTPYVETANMPIVVATSSIALQKAIVTDYIPELSKILIEYGMIKEPLTAALRKGKEHYICEHNLKSHIPFEYDLAMKEILESLQEPKAPIDLSEIDGLTPHAKRKIAVPQHCYTNCSLRDNCSYLRFRKKMQSPKIDIQVCNHNYLLADTLRRADDEYPLIPNYQSIIIDEAHKFLQAARSMYGVELSDLSATEIQDSICSLKFKREDTEKMAKQIAKKLYDESRRLFRGLITNVQDSDIDDDKKRFSTVMDADATRHLRNIRNISDMLYELLSSEPIMNNINGFKTQILWNLKEIRNQSAALVRHHELIYWLEIDDRENRICAIPNNLDKRLYEDIWSKGIPVILTSGTLSAGGDFSHSKRTLGLGYVGNRLMETSKPSPFNHYENTLLYISENMPFPDQRNRDYITALVDEIERLIFVAHGHTAVLFTSYNTMGLVYAELKNRSMPFPMFRLDKGGVREIERFKKSGNGVLFASGSMWEGIDIPGDSLSMLIIVKLPFSPPDPIGEYEQTLYESMSEYKRLVVVPEMLIKLKQGFGRLIRTEKDTGAAAILDSRANIEGLYRQDVLNVLPDCPVTSSIADLEQFFRSKKTESYFAD